ncbi:hypothetical protein HDU96_001662 [Phlyctochytrium bullatum]|nr:hypothetical protein HDU96_001662 [Phlyctochytrium bullatum]
MSSAVPASCCQLAPVKQNYTPVGETIKIGDMDVYLTGKKGAKNAIVIHYDIFGMHDNTKQVADILSTHGVRVAIPDLCRGDPWPTSKWPPEDMGAVFKHIFGVAPTEKVETDLKAALDYLKTEGSEKFGLIGFCWGGLNASVLMNNAYYQAAAVIHPAGFKVEALEKCVGPMAFFPAMDDADFTPHAEFLKTKFGDLVVHKRFDDVPHGFCASRSNFDDELTGKRANECLDEVHKFFTNVFNSKL